MRSLLTLLVFVFSLCHCVTPVFAFTNPLVATTSATATVPTTTPTTSDTTAPSNPILIKPENGTITGDNRPEFVWRRSTDNNSNSLTYTLYLNGVATYLGISNIGNSSNHGYTARIDGNEIRLHPTSSLLDGPYDWFVTASDLASNTSSSTTWNFKIDTVQPHLFITDIDIYHDLSIDSAHPENFDGPTFDIAGPKAVYFTIYSESWSTVTLQFLSNDRAMIHQSAWPVSGSGVIYPYQHLDIGRYLLLVSAFDQGGNTTTLNEIPLNILQAQISFPLPAIPGLPTSYSLPYTPYTVPSLTASIANIKTRLSPSLLVSLSLAVLLFILLILFWKKRFNLIILTPNGQPLSTAKIYHSLPTYRTHTSPIFLTHKEPILYTLKNQDHGRLYIPHLTRYSTFTILLGTTTYIFSLSVKRSLYTIILG